MRSSPCRYRYDVVAITRHRLLAISRRGDVGPWPNLTSAKLRAKVIHDPYDTLESFDFARSEVRDLLIAIGQSGIPPGASVRWSSRPISRKLYAYMRTAKPLRDYSNERLANFLRQFGVTFRQFAKAGGEVVSAAGKLPA
jgi:hypothetical protein